MIGGLTGGGWWIFARLPIIQGVNPNIILDYRVLLVNFWVGCAGKLGLRLGNGLGYWVPSKEQGSKDHYSLTKKGRRLKELGKFKGLKFRTLFHYSPIILMSIFLMG